MRFFAAFAAIIGVASAAVAGRAGQCKAKNEYVYNTINRFCAKTDMVVPSSYAANGLNSLNSYVHLSVQGKCSPAQWVPSAICKAQFFQMCVRGDALGQRNANWGRNLCQSWDIAASRSQHTNGNANEPKTNGQVESKQGSFKQFFKLLGNLKRDDGMYDAADIEEARRLAVEGGDKE